MARRGEARRGLAWRGQAWLGKGLEAGDWQASGFEPLTPTQGLAWRGWAGPGVAGPGTAGQGHKERGWQASRFEPSTRTAKQSSPHRTHDTAERHQGDPAMDIKIEITGVTPLLCHNIALADPDNPFVQQIATYTSKRKKTEDDRRAIERLEWFGGLYVENGSPVIPTGNIRKAFVQAGKISKQGIQVVRSLNFTDLHVPIAYNGPADLEELFADKSFSNRSAVGISGKRTMRVRPQFTSWALVANALLLEEVMDPDDFRRIAARAGQAEGLGDNRVNGYGRFTVSVV